MEHRWGVRVAVDIPVRLTAPCSSYPKAGRLKNLSISGAWINVALEARPLSRLEVTIDSALRPSRNAPVISAYVVRRTELGVAVEWCGRVPHAIVKLLRQASPFSNPISPKRKRSVGSSAPP